MVRREQSKQVGGGSHTVKGSVFGGVGDDGAEEVGVLLAWEDHDRVALDSQGVIQRIWAGNTFNRDHG